jgi:hypothetical protein
MESFRTNHRAGRSAAALLLVLLTGGCEEMDDETPAVSAPVAIQPPTPQVRCGAHSADWAEYSAIKLAKYRVSYGNGCKSFSGLSLDAAKAAADAWCAQPGNSPCQFAFQAGPAPANQVCGPGSPGWPEFAANKLAKVRVEDLATLDCKSFFGSDLDALRADASRWCREANRACQDPFGAPMAPPQAWCGPGSPGWDEYANYIGARVRVMVEGNHDCLWTFGKSIDEAMERMLAKCQAKGQTCRLADSSEGGATLAEKRASAEAQARTAAEQAQRADAARTQVQQSAIAAHDRCLNVCESQQQACNNRQDSAQNESLLNMGSAIANRNSGALTGATSSYAAANGSECSDQYNICTAGCPGLP